MAISETPDPTLESDVDIAEHEVHDILRNERRRRVLEYLIQSVGKVSLRQLAEEIAAEETGRSPPPKQARWSVYNSLNQTHLPMLDDRDIIDYDRDRKTIELRPEVRRLNTYLKSQSIQGLSWMEYYRALCTLAMTVVVASQLDIPVLSDMDMLIWGTFVLGFIAVSTAYQFWTNRWLYFQRLLS